MLHRGVALTRPALRQLASGRSSFQSNPLRALAAHPLGSLTTLTHASSQSSAGPSVVSSPSSVSSPASPTSPSYPPLNFDDVSRSFQSKSDSELLRALLVFRLCTIRPLVAHADRLLHWSNSLLGKRITKALLKRTFFGQFVAGETAEEVVPVVDRMEKSGLGAILDWAAEADVGGEHGGTGHAVSARALSEAAERVHEENTALFASSIEAAGRRKDGFAAIKLTAMAAPELLISVTNYVLAVKRLYYAMLTGEKVDQRDVPHLDASSAVTRSQFITGLRTNGMNVSDAEASRMFDAIAAAPSPASRSSSSSPSAAASPALSLSFIRFSNYFSPLTERTLPILPALSRASFVSWTAVAERAEHLASLSLQHRVRLLVDAEQTYLQPAIDTLAELMQRTANVSFPYVYNTYQCYLRDSFSRVQMDVRRAEEEGWMMGAKTVRGAYMWQERKRAQDMHYADPIQPSFSSTTSNYHAVVDYFLRRVPQSTHLVVAGHNEATVHWVCRRMDELGLLRDADGVFFGQLLGMCDHVSYSLAASGYRVVKVTPYGPLEEVLPYLIRRAQENADVLDRATKERQLVWKELLRRRLPLLARARQEERNTAKA